jgi:hypothetical protein
LNGNVTARASPPRRGDAPDLRADEAWHGRSGQDEGGHRREWTPNPREGLPAARCNNRQSDRRGMFCGRPASSLEDARSVRVRGPVAAAVTTAASSPDVRVRKAFAAKLLAKAHQHQITVPSTSHFDPDRLVSCSGTRYRGRLSSSVCRYSTVEPLITCPCSGRRKSPASQRPVACQAGQGCLPNAACSCCLDHPTGAPHVFFRGYGRMRRRRPLAAAKVR